jgi:hypothetical protein
MGTCSVCYIDFYLVNILEELGAEFVKHVIKPEKVTLIMMVLVDMAMNSS